MYQKQRNNARFHKRQNLTWFKTIFDSENSLLIVKVDLSVKHHEIRLLSLLEWMRKTPEAQQLTRHSTHQDAGDVNLHGKGDWECDIRQQLKPSMFPWLIYIHTYTHTQNEFCSSLLPASSNKEKESCVRIAGFGKVWLFRRDAQCAPVRARTGYWVQRAHAHAQRTDTWGRDFAMNYIA